MVSACAQKGESHVKGTEISVYNVQAKIDSGANILLLDVRTPAEFTGKDGHIAGSMLMPLSDLNVRIDELEEYKDSEIIVICHVGSRSGFATRKLRAQGYDAFNMLGGIVAWNKMQAQDKKQAE